MGNLEQVEDRQLARKTARLRRLLRKAGTLQVDLADSANAFFASRPFRLIAEPSASAPDSDVYRFRLDRPIPRRVRRLSRRLLRVLRRIGEALPDRPADGALEKVRRHETPLLRPSIVAGARAATELSLDGESLPGEATIGAPIWSPSTKEVSVVGQDPKGGLKGRVEVRFQLELSGRNARPRQSVVALTGAAIWEAEQLLEKGSAARRRPQPVPAGRHPQGVREEDSA